MTKPAGQAALNELAPEIASWFVGPAGARGGVLLRRASVVPAGSTDVRLNRGDRAARERSCRKAVESEASP